ncbi:MAG: response regulator [Phaeodactylibacter sp.]|nr:response regulator [Phaeodactylibacter sp.]MCB9302585.1 response regulator [Lewinellaceae bacterium]
MDILFFDDNQVLNYIVSQKLEKEGYRVYSALSRDEALSWLGKGNKPAIALLDIVDEERVFRGEIIPRDPEAGFKIADKIKEIDPTIPILFFSGYGDDEEISHKIKAQYITADFYDKGAKDTHEVNEKILKEISGKINSLFDLQRQQSGLESYFSKAFGNKIGIEKKEALNEENEYEKKDWERRIYIVDIFDLMLVQTRNEPQKDLIEMKTQRLDEKELVKVISRELKERMLTLKEITESVKVSELKEAIGALNRAINQDKWDSEDKRAKSPYLKYTNQCLLFLFKNKEGYFRLTGGAEWLDEFINSQLDFVTDKSKKDWLPEEKERYEVIMEAILNKLKKRIDETTALEPITNKDANKWSSELSNPILFVEYQQGESPGDANLILIRTVTRQFLEILDSGGEKNKIFNVNLTDFENQIQVLCDTKGITYPFLRLNSIIINPSFVQSFMEASICFDNGTTASISNTDYQELRKGFPTLRT